jgi:DNA-binding NtrC family response regulator
MTTTERLIRLLLVDDEHEFLEAVTPALERRGLDVTAVTNGVEALALLDQWPFDVVVLDVKMPGMDGIDVFHRLAEREPPLPVVILTGHGNIQQAFETSREGVFDYLTKPCRVDDLVEVVQRACRSQASGPLLPFSDSG